MPLYIRVSGTDGGELELEVDRITGQLQKLIVLIDPPSDDSVSIASSLDVTQRPDVAPVMDLSMWPQKVTPDYTEPENHIIWVSETLRFTQTAEFTELRFADQQTSTRLKCGNVSVGISIDGYLASVTTPTNAIQFVDTPGYPTWETIQESENQKSDNH